MKVKHRYGNHCASVEVTEAGVSLDYGQALAVYEALADHPDARLRAIARAIRQGASEYWGLYP